HLIVDGISWRILLEDLQLLYLQLHQAGTAQLPLKSFSTKDWVERLQTLERSSEIPYWHTVTQAELAPLPVDFAGGDNTMAQAETFSVALTVDETRCLLQEVPAAYPVQMNDLLLTALGLALKPWAGPTLRLAVEGHGRPDDLDLSRTVGWLTALYPLLIKLPEQEELGAIIKAVKETVRSVPDQGLGYGILRYLQGHAVPATETPIRFNYLGQTDQLFANSEWFTSAPESTGSSRSPYGCRDVLIEINAVISQGHLKLHWTYSRRLHRQGTISDLARAHVEQLRGLMEYCLSADTDPGYSPADFPQMALAQDELDQLLDTLDFSIVGGQDG
uniref:condensation domain-containing protein n=1 Tax=Acaryochloris sp. IP29b_bin.137 TaxID=2969217 RepID=UPI002635EAC9